MRRKHKKKYNFIYDLLATDENGLVGLIAYAIYKKHKIEFISRLKKEKGREPTNEEIDAFCKASTTDSQLEKYMSDAQAILSDVVLNTTQEEIKANEKRMLEDYQANIKKCLPPWWQNVLCSVIASFIFSALGMFFYYLGVSENEQAQTQHLEIIHKVDSANTPITIIK